MILLDTNVLSELLRPAPNPAIENWLAEQPSERVYISAITEAELRYGAAILPAGKRRAGLSDMIDELIRNFDYRILPFDSQAAIAYAEISAARRLSGRPISQSDAQIAAIARSCAAGLATRNVKDFVACGIDIINPWVVST
jgi:predicted nucleic acid-binding protein